MTQPADNLSLIRACVLLSRWPGDSLQRLARAAVVVRFGAGVDVTTDAEPGVATYVVVRGSVQVVHPGRLEPVAVLGPGALFGDGTTGMRGRQAGRVRTVTPVTALAIPRWDFRAELHAFRAAEAAAAARQAEHEARMPLRRPTS